MSIPIVLTSHMVTYEGMRVELNRNVTLQQQNHTLFVGHLLVVGVTPHRKIVDRDTLPSRLKVYLQASQQLSKLISRIWDLRSQLIYPEEVRLNQQLLPLTGFGLTQWQRSQIIHQVLLGSLPQLLGLLLAFEFKVDVGQVFTDISQITGLERLTQQLIYEHGEFVALTLQRLHLTPQELSLGGVDLILNVEFLNSPILIECDDGCNEMTFVGVDTIRLQILSPITL